MCRLVTALTFLSLASSALAQTPDPFRAGLPQTTARRIDRLMRDSSTRRLERGGRIESSETVPGSIVAWGGTLTVAGQVGGEVVVFDGNVVLESGALVRGDVTVVGGSLFGLEMARVEGGVMEYEEGFGLAARRILAHTRERDPDDDHGGSNIVVGIEGNYNRVEGLPVRFGPDLRTGGVNPFRAHAFAVLRTETGFFDTRAMGYRAGFEQRIPGGGGLWLGASAYSLVQPIETLSFTNTEATFAAALFHEDLRDYFERTGWSAHMRFTRDPVTLRVEYAREDHETTPLRDPWTLFREDASWRFLPLAAEGEMGLVRASAELDTHDDEGGWYARAEVQRSVSGEIAIPARFVSGLDPMEPLAPTLFAEPFTVGFADLRRYQPIGSEGILAFRVMAGGNLQRAPLPPQYQLALGGPGTLPGYAQFHADCGARTNLVMRQDDASQENPAVHYGAYGCDRVALFQVEYRGGLNLRFGDDDESEHRRHRHWDIDIEPDWTVFFDAGRGWSYDGSTPGLVRTSQRTLFDAGAGFIFGGLGVFAAVPLTGEERPLRLFVRLGNRF
jgi:hypothetical protein